jgi:nucleotide-binding universal stress UspA family protein
MASQQDVITDGREATPLIVVGVHQTAASDAALRWAVREARLRQARLHLVLARDPGARSRASYARPADPALEGGDAAWLDGAAVSAALALPPGRVTSELADGLPARVLTDRTAGASLLVIGAAHDSEFLGPVARACLRLALCPVVILVPDALWAAPVPDRRAPAQPAAV